MSKPVFPPDFLWGASTASHQVEGGTRNQWTEWEQAHAAPLAATAEKRWGHLEIWPEIKPEATSPENYLSGNGVDHYNRYEEDFAIIKQLGMNSFRFGIEWSRIEPEAGQWDEAELEHYRVYIQKMRAAGIEPVLTLWHWTMPVWFTDMGGMAKRRNLVYWRRYINKLADALDWSQVTFVLTINEANTYSGLSYQTGEWPPEQKNPLKTLAVYYNLALAHRQAVAVLRPRFSHLKFGSAHQCNQVLPTRPHKLSDMIMARIQKYYWNWWYLNRINKTQDFVGINYYFTDYRDGFSLMPKNPDHPVNDLGWYMNPAGIETVITEAWQRYRKPILITENGVADRRDTYRSWWLEETVAAMERSIQGGANVMGYLHWSLLDNFEWSSGWWPHFGLVAVDRHTMERTVRPSAARYKQLISAAKAGETVAPPAAKSGSQTASE